MQKKKTIDAWKMKKWITIIAPKSFDEKELGHAITVSSEGILNRTIKKSLRDITGNISHQNVGLYFKISEIKGEKANTAVVGHELGRGYIGREIKRMSGIVKVVLDLNTKDKYKMRITILAFSRRGMSSTQLKAIRKKVSEAVLKKAIKTQFEKLFQEIVFGKLSSELFKEIKPIYPVNRVEIIKSTVL